MGGTSVFGFRVDVDVPARFHRGWADAGFTHSPSITQNGASSGPFLRGGICLEGGQADGKGRLGVTSNQILGNGGWGLCRHPEGFDMQITLSGNTISGNTDGASQW